MKKKKILLASLLVATVLIGYSNESKLDVSAYNNKIQKTTVQEISLSLSGKSEVKLNTNKETNIKKKKKKKKKSSSKLIKGMRSKFKKAMDSYEKFYNEYFKILKKYKKNPTDLSILADYTNYVGKLVDVNNDFDKWDGSLNDVELKYYLKLQSRILKKLSELE